MTPERWNRLKAILEQWDAATPAGRTPALLDQLCEGDAGLRAEVEPFLAQEDTDLFLQSLIAGQAASLSQTTTRQERFGHYRIVNRIGQGGMGAVYEAVRVDDFHKKVALKIIRQGLDSDFARQRFVQERQLLAKLEHPYIARLLDGGEADDGSPWLVLEFVDGVPITLACAQLDRTARLRLFLKVCEAAEYAHRNLIIHRDLKPANIMVTPGGEPKLLDFGIAKLLDPGATNTQTGFAALTPDYASPEQVRAEPVTTASDVYSLGVILYQMLTDRKPYSLETATALEMDRVICLQPPAPPGLGDELDHILLMALRKEPERRYAGVQRFAEDVERYLENRPVAARPDTFHYRTQKFVRRNWLALAAAALALAGIGTGSVMALYQARIAQHRLNDVRQLSNTLLFDLQKEIANLPGGLKARQILVTTALKYLDGLAPNASGDPAFLRDLGRAYQMVGEIQGRSGAENLGKLDDALVSWRKSLDLFRAALPSDPTVTPDIGKTQIEIAWSLHFRGKDKEALVDYRSTIALLESYLSKSPQDERAIETLSTAYGDATISYLEQAEFSNALSALDKSREYRERLPILDSAEAAKRRRDYNERLANILAENGDHARFFKIAQAGLADIEELKKTSPNNLRARFQEMGLHNLMSEVYDSDYAPTMGDTKSALPHSQTALAIVHELLSKDPVNLGAKSNLGLILKRLAYLHRDSSPAESLEEARQSIAVFAEVLAASPKLGMALEVQASAKSMAAMALARLHRGAEARRYLEEAAQTHRQLLQESNNAIDQQINSAIGFITACTVYRTLGEPAPALDACLSAVGLAKQIEAHGPREVALFYVVGAAYSAYGRTLAEAMRPPEEVRTWFERDAAIWRNWRNPNDYVELRKRQAVANLASVGVRGPGF